MTELQLISDQFTENVKYIYVLLKERTPLESISFVMPTWEEHTEYWANRQPHGYIIYEGHDRTGYCYITAHSELGVHIEKGWRRKGLAETALQKLMALHKKDYYLANIAPHNYPSKMLFAKLGFKPIQETWKR